MNFKSINVKNISRAPNREHAKYVNKEMYSFYYYCIMQHDHASVLSFSHVYFVIGYFLWWLSYRACLGDIISHISYSLASRAWYFYILYFVYY